MTFWQSLVRHVPLRPKALLFSGAAYCLRHRKGSPRATIHIPAYQGLPVHMISQTPGSCLKQIQLERDCGHLLRDKLPRLRVFNNKNTLILLLFNQEVEPPIKTANGASQMTCRKSCQCPCLKACCTTCPSARNKTSPRARRADGQC